MTVFLHGLGHAHPRNEITNRFLEDLDIGTSDAWIIERVGIRSRRTVLALDYIRTTRNRDLSAALEAAEMSNAALGAAAAEMAIARAGIAPDDVGMVIAGTSASDTHSPAEACNVARLLDLEVPAFDVQSACTSFYVQLYLLSLMDPERLPDFVLLVAPDTLTTTVDYNDRSSAVLWGDAAAAAVLSTRHAAPRHILGNSLESSPAGADKVVVPRSAHFRQEGRTVQMFGIKRMTRCLAQLREQFACEDRVFHFVGHQANLRMLDAVRKHCGIPAECHHTNVEWYGNTGAASSASVISMNWDKWKPRDDVAVAGVGAGLTWSSYLLRFEETP
ncbi:MAG: ketoacyl-ACP synthase III [Myxococcales bacterium]|nr:ketoacyl-ACP synthase III [Myxococcales bacterium]MDH5305730.1 ketoacyl-ACP synthase III [Myxococcales bacterium]MDH5566177.1 ketoacyl-ACP synthase III [Myxococcales bacterium]